MNQTFLEFIRSNNHSEIIDVLCRFRVREANKKNEIEKIKKLSRKYKPDNSQENEKIYSIMPPRRHWVQLGGKNRTKPSTDSNKKQRLTSFEYNMKSLKLTIKKDRENKTEYLYLDRLDTFINELITKVEKGKIKFESKTIPLLKGFDSNTKKNECRPVSIFTDLYDSTILILINKFLTKLFDCEFYSESLAFRAKREYHGENKHTNHHDAINRIIDYLTKFNDKDIYVAECDMKKFYDTVNHEIIISEFGRLFDKRESETGNSFDIERKILEKYLECYTFSKNVKIYNEDREYWKKHKIKNGNFKWVDFEEENIYSPDSIDKIGIGIPQGGALSGLIANVVLNTIDQRLERELSENELYLRYCDDMILFSTNRDKCCEIFNTYQSGLKEIKLIPHKQNTEKDTELGIRTSPKFWKHKTKEPYNWKIKGNKEDPEWIGFVGYEIKRDGQIRIRKNSLRKEIKKQKTYINTLYQKLKDLKTVSKGTLSASYTTHLVNMSVGRVHIWNAQYIDNDLCWITGFRRLTYNKYSKQQIRLLDKCRNKTIRIADKKFQNIDDSSEQYKPKSLKKDERLSGALRFYGKPFSYYYHFLWMTNLIN